jgi:hypothetical protein
MAILALASVRASVLASALALAPAPSPDEPAPEEATVPLVDALVVRAGATCLERDRLAEQVRTWFDHERIDARLVVDVVGDAADPRKLAFTLRRGDQVISVRRFDPAPDRCADLHAVVGLAIALAIDATLLEAMTGDPSRPLRPPDPPPYYWGAEPEPPPPKPKPRKWTLWAEVTGQLSIGAPPPVGGGGRLGFGTSWRRILDLRVGVTAGSSGSVPLGEGRAFLWFLAGRFDICAGPPWERLRPRGCVGFLGGNAYAEGRGFENSRSTHQPWIAIPVGVDLEVQLARRVFLLFGIEGLPALIRPGFTARATIGGQSARKFAIFGANVRAGLAFRLW